MSKPKLKALGKKVTRFGGLETFPKPPNVVTVKCTSDEVTAVCPVTGQPDWYKVEIEYEPDRLCVESKTLKLYLQSFRNEGHFCEHFANLILKGICTALSPLSCRVTITQKPRGGIAIESTAFWRI